MAKRECIEIPGVAHTGGRYPGFIPFGTKIGNLLFSGATFGADPKTGKMGETPERQAELAFQNTYTLLERAGFSTDDVAHMFVWYKDHKYREVVNKPFVEMFPNQNDRPARHAIVTDLPGDSLIQIEIIAVHGQGKRQCIEIPGVAHTGGGPPGFIPFGTRIGDLLFSGATFGADPATGKLADTPERQAELAFQNTRTLLETAGFSTDDIGHMFVWYKDHKYRAAVNKPFVEMFPNQNDRPARHAVVADLPGDLLIQLEIIALRGAGKRQCIEIPGVAHTGGGPPGFIPFGTRIGNLLFSGATFGADPATGQLADTPERQAELAFRNTRTLLETAGFSTDDVAHMFVWYKDHSYREAVNKYYEEMFPNQNDRPARHAIRADLPGDLLVQVEITAVR